MVTRSVRFGLAALAAIISAVWWGAGVAHAHPLHTSFAEITYDASSRAVVISLRVFADDLAKASSAYRVRLSSKGDRVISPHIVYAAASFRIADDAGRPLTLDSCGEKQVGDLMWLCFRAQVAARPKSLLVSSRILFDVYKDQINVVQATLGNRKSSSLFTLGDGFRQLR